MFKTTYPFYYISNNNKCLPSLQFDLQSTVTYLAVVNITVSR